MSRLIDGDALRAEFPMPEDITDPNQALVHITGIWAEIDNAPTIEERKKGRWEMLQIPISPPVYKCSVCGSHALQTVTGCLLNRHLESNLTKFCPNCGADLRGEQDDSI